MRTLTQHNGLWGILAMTVFASMLMVLYISPQKSHDFWYLEAKFSDIGGLKVGSDVLMSGLPVGSVESIALTPDFDVLVRIKLVSGLEVPDDSDLRIQTPGLFSTPHLALLAGGSFDLLEDGDEFSFTQSSVDFLKLLQQIVESATAAPST